MIRKVALGAATTALAVTATLAGLTPAASASTVSPTGIDATGGSDDTAALQKLIDGLPDGSTLTFPAGGKYRIEGTLHVKHKNNLTIEGNGALFFATTTGDRTRSQWEFDGGSNIVVRDVVVKGANPYAGTSTAAYAASLEAQHAFNIFSTTGIELDHVTATDVYGDFVYIGAQAGGLARNVYIHDSTFARNGRQGISITGGDGVRIIHNTISDVRRTTFDLEPNGSSWGALNVDIEDNTIGAGRLNLLSSQGVGPVANVTFANNTINRGVIVVVNSSDGGRRGPFTFTGNIATHSWGGAAGSAALNFSDVDGVTITGNTIPIQAGRGDYGVKAINSCDVNVTDNAFTNAVDNLYTTPGPSCTPTTTAPVTNPAPTPGGSQGVPPITTTSAPPRPPATSSPTVNAAPEPSATSEPESTPSAQQSTQAPKPNKSKSPAPAAAAHSAKPPKSDGKKNADRVAGAPALAINTGSFGGPDAAAAMGSDTQASVISSRILIACAAALALLVLLGIRLLGGRRPRRLRTVRRHRAPATNPVFAMEVLPRRYAR